MRVIDCQITIGTKTSVYAKRWEIETAFAEFKSQLAGRTTQLRSHSPAGAMAEVDALLIGYFAVFRLALKSARQAQVDPLTI